MQLRGVLVQGQAATALTQRVPPGFFVCVGGWDCQTILTYKIRHPGPSLQIASISTTVSYKLGFKAKRVVYQTAGGLDYTQVLACYAHKDGRLLEACELPRGWTKPHNW